MKSLDKSTLVYRFLSGSFWSLIGALVSRGSGLIAAIVVARILGKTTFGELGIIQNTIGMIGSIAGFGLGMTATKFIAEFRESDPGKTGRIAALSSAFSWATSLLAATVLFIFAPWLAANTLAAPHLSDEIRIGTLFMLLSAVNAAQTGIIVGFEAFKTTARINLWLGIVSFPLNIIGAYVWGLYGAIWALVINSAFNWLLNYHAIRKEFFRKKISFSYNNCWSERDILWRFSLPSFLGGIMTTPVIWAANAMLANQPGGYAELGVYNALNRIKQVPEMALNIIIAPLLPILSDLLNKNNFKQYRKSLRYAQSISLVVTAPFCLVLIAYPEIALLPFGADFASNDQLTQWVLGQTLVYGCIGQVAYNIFSSFNRLWFGFGVNFIWGVVFLTAAYYTIPVYGAIGLAASYTLSQILISFINIIAIVKSTGTSLALTFLKNLFFVALLVFFCWIASTYQTNEYKIVMGISTSLLLAMKAFKAVKQANKN
ncbi:MAG: oligosaccharide flippase family protein [Methylomonas sp.]|nr:oligosaccharide flippase family protein [Methylomonas sp.]PPD20524.1 MAG: polysaccharide biosynthesis protein [Methylomonas sp.]PPD40794.1 MAG: polysaccharide biosynthesis protein [Methylomonas sp.]PPD52948.1 MAG: polysaccharide biosynthesis protein [Methylomonas sp.]